MSQYDFHVCDVATNVKLWNGHLVNRVRPYPTECDTSIWAPRPKLCGRCGVCAVPWHLQNCPRDRGRERILWNAMKCLYFKILWAPFPTYNKCNDIYSKYFKIFMYILGVLNSILPGRISWSILSWRSVHFEKKTSNINQSQLPRNFRHSFPNRCCQTACESHCQLCDLSEQKVSRFWITAPERSRKCDQPTVTSCSQLLCSKSIQNWERSCTALISKSYYI